MFVVFGDMMRRSNPRIVRTTLNNVFACVCFRSAVCFAKQNVFLRVCGEVHVGHSKSATFMFHECEPVSPIVGMRLSTFLFSFVRRTKAQDRLHCRVQPSPFHVRMRFSTVLLFVLSFVQKKRRTGRTEKCTARGIAS